MSQSQISNLPEFTEAAIFGRVVEGTGNLSPELAGHMLSLTISKNDQLRVQELLQKNSDGELSESEQKELENLNHVADLISLWHSQARTALRQPNG